jgi:plasmid stabilization system protein ParE
MSLEVHLRPEAEADIEEAALWYEKQREGLGQDFLDELLSAINAISENPHIFPVVHRNTHRAIIHRFPFGVYYRVEDDLIVVVAAMHGSRHPRRWKQRT